MFLQPKRKQVLELTGKTWVPALELDDGSAISDSKKIIEWAGQNPASS
jgi:glutathione S-transferase